MMAKEEKQVQKRADGTPYQKRNPATFEKITAGRDSAPRLGKLVEEINAKLSVRQVAGMLVDAMNNAPSGSLIQSKLFATYEKLIVTNEEINPPETDKDLMEMTKDQLIRLLKDEFGIVPTPKPEAPAQDAGQAEKPPHGE